MRYQEPIYTQNNNSGVRNKDILNVNMSSDLCIFEPPQYSLSGASKIDCTGSTSGNTYIILSNLDVIPLSFNFTGNTDSFISTNTDFRFEIYKYSDLFSGFSSTAVYKSTPTSYSAFSATNISDYSIPVSGLSIDGEYLIKPQYNFKVCTDLLGRLNKTIDTFSYISGTEYGLYNQYSDYYFIAIKEAEKPLLTQNVSNVVESSKLRQQVFIPKIGQTSFNIQNQISGDFIVTLNGLVLSPTLDYTFTANTVFLNGETAQDDIITVIFSTGAAGYNLIGDNINVTSSITSGATNQEGSNLIYYNTTTGKYEIFTTVTPDDGGSVIVMLNGATLANGVDFYQSSTNPKRLILEGDILIGDIITIIYFPKTSTSMGLNTNTPMVTWQINNPPTKQNGFFTLEVGYDNTFSNLYYSGITDYRVGVGYYNQSFIASGSVGTTLFYRVKNDKNYVTICGNIINSSNYSEIIPITIQNNSINTY